MGLTEIIPLAFTAVGGIFVYFQWQKSLKTRRAEFIYQIIDRFLTDKDLLEATYRLEYDLEWYDESFHHENSENKIDKLLFFINYLCYLQSTGNISDKEFMTFKYQVHRICISSRKYLWNLYHFSRKNKADCPFQLIINYGIKSGILSKDFKTDTTLYTKTLNW